MIQRELWTLYRSRLQILETLAGLATILQTISKPDSTARQKLFWARNGEQVPMFGVCLLWYDNVLSAKYTV